MPTHCLTPKFFMFPLRDGSHIKPSNLFVLQSVIFMVSIQTDTFQAYFLPVWHSTSGWEACQGDKFI